MRESNDLEKNARMTAEIHALGDYNSFSRPKSSSVRIFCFFDCFLSAFLKILTSSCVPLFEPGYYLCSFLFPLVLQVLPLRTVLLDPSVNNFPRSKTRTELMKRIKLSAAPHPSYDLVRLIHNDTVFFFICVGHCKLSPLHSDNFSRNN